MGSLAGKLDALLDTKLKDEIEKLGIRLLKLSKARDLPLTARCWMKDVRQLSYDMENYVATEADWIEKLSGIFRARVKEANRRYHRYNLKSFPGCTDVFPIIDHQLPSVDGGQKTDPFVVGLHDEGGAVDKLGRWLTDDSKKELNVLSIVGVGGIGKTMLAKQLWRKHIAGDYFHCRAFVRAAKKPDMRRILRSMLAQVRPHQPPDASGMHDLIHDLTEHLQDKRYFLIIDDLWAASVWDVASRAFPEGNQGSRIVTTTEIEDVALACCSYQSRYIFKMEPLSESHSKELFTRAVFGSGEEKSRQLDEESVDIIRRCAGLPQAIISISSVLASQGGENTVQNRVQIRNNLPTNSISDKIQKQVLNFCYNCLPSCLQTCLLYLSLYPENYIILKEDIMLQWVAEGFICAPTQNDRMKVAGSYFDQLVNMGLIQHIDVDYSDEVLYYAVHHMVHELITSKSIEENLITLIDYSQRTVRFANKVSRLSLQFGSATHATSPASTTTGLLGVRSLAFFGLMICRPSIFQFKLLRSLILHIWADQPRTGVDLWRISELFLLRYLQVTCNDTVHLPGQLQCLKHLETLEINATVATIPSDVVHILRLLHLRLGDGARMPDLTGVITNVNLNPPIAAILLDESSSPPNSVQTIELFQPICRIPKWIGQLSNLCILKVLVRELQMDDISNLQGLPLTSLSLHVQRRTTGAIDFAPGAFTALEYFEFRCGVLSLFFFKGTMPNLLRLKLCFNAHGGEQYVGYLFGLEDILSVQKISVLIGPAAGAGERDMKAAEAAVKKALGKHQSKVSVKRADMVEEEFDHLSRRQKHMSTWLQKISGECDMKAAEAAFKKALGKHPSNVSVERAEEDFDPPEVHPSISSEQPVIPKQVSGEAIKQNIYLRRRSKEDTVQVQALAALLSSSGDTFPGSGHRPVDRKTWMAGLGAHNVRVHQVLWPGTRHSATNGICPSFSGPATECQTLSVYEQLAMGCRVLDVRVRRDRLICHNSIFSYHLDVVLGDLRRFLGETSSEIIILEIRTEFGQHDPPGFDRFLVDQLGDHLVRQDDQVFNKTIAELLPRRVICVWKPRKPPAPNPGELLWSAKCLKDAPVDTGTGPKLKFDNNLLALSKNPPVSQRNYFYRVENTLTPNGFNAEVARWDLHRFTRLFISQAAKLHGDKLQIFSTDFIEEDFVDACVGATKARIDASLGV